MRFAGNNILTRLTCLLILSIVLFTQFNQQKWKEDNGVIVSDVRGYYAYLPALFINNDLKFTDPTVYQSHLGSLVWYLEEEDGTRHIKYTCGMAMLYSPFFFTAHMLAEPLGYPADGFSEPYKFALVMSATFYMILGLFFLSRFLLLHFKDHIVSTTLIILFLATNIYHYYAADMTYSHGYSFALIALFFYASARWLSSSSFKWSIIIGLSAGLFVLVRPIDLLFVLFFPLYQVTSLSLFKGRLQLFWKNWKHTLLMFACFMLVMLPQLMYYKYIFGSFTHYSYSGESFFFGNPHLLDILFSYRNGWLVYTPIMLFAFLGMFFLLKRKEGFGAFVLPVFFIYLYVIASWWCWWYVGFGNRAFINLYPLLCIPLAYFVQFIMSQRWIAKSVFSLIVIGAITLNVFQSKQLQSGTLHWGAMTKEAYWDSFGREFPTQLYGFYLRFPVTEKALEGVDAVYDLVADTLSEEYINFDLKEQCDTVYHKNWSADVTRSGKGALHVPGDEFSLYRTVPTKDAQKLHTSVWVKCEEEVFVVASKEMPAIIYNATSDPVEEENGWKRLHMYTNIPEDYPLDSIDIYFWNQHHKPFWVDDMKLTWTKERFEILELE